MTSKALVVVVGIQLWAVVSVAAQPVFTQTAAFCPIDLSYQQLSSLIGRIRDLTQKANAGAADSPLIDSVSIEAVGTKFEAEGDFSLATLSQGPEVATSVRYSYNHRKQPITEVVLQLSDYSRSVSVAGSDKIQVDSLLSLVSSDLNRLGCSLGGSSHRTLGGLALMFTILLLTSVLQAVPSGRVRAAFLTIAVVNLVSLIALPWPDWLPGTAVRVVEASFLSRNASLIGFVGTLAGLVSLVVSVVPYFNRKQQTPPKSAAETDSPEA